MSTDKRGKKEVSHFWLRTVNTFKCSTVTPVNQSLDPQMTKEKRIVLGQF